VVWCGVVWRGATLSLLADNDEDRRWCMLWRHRYGVV
jgi:hypothetical protein